MLVLAFAFLTFITVASSAIAAIASSFVAVHAVDLASTFTFTVIRPYFLKF